MIFSPGNNKENDVSFAKVFDSSSDIVGSTNNNNSNNGCGALLGGGGTSGLIVDQSAYSDAGSMDTECHQNPNFDSIDLIIIKNNYRQFRLIPREVVHYMMENFIDDETLLKCILPLSREYEDYSLDLIYRRNIGRGDAMLSFIFNYKTIAQITQSAETSEEESLLFSSEMFDKLFQNNVLKVIDLHDFCKHSTQIAVPLMLQYSRQCEEFIKVCKKAKKKIVSPTSLVEGTVFPTSPVVENPDVFLLGEQHFNFKRLKQGVLSPRSALPVLHDESLEKKQALLHKRYYQLVSLLNLILSVDYLKTWQWCIMNDMSMFRRISSKNGEKLAKIPKSVKRKEEEAFLFYRELFFNTREIKKIKSLTIYKKTL